MKRKEYILLIQEKKKKKKKKKKWARWRQLPNHAIDSCMSVCLFVCLFLPYRSNAETRQKRLLGSRHCRRRSKAEHDNGKAEREPIANFSLKLEYLSLSLSLFDVYLCTTIFNSCALACLYWYGTTFCSLFVVACLDISLLLFFFPLTSQSVHTKIKCRPWEPKKAEPKKPKCRITSKLMSIIIHSWCVCVCVKMNGGESDIWSVSRSLLVCGRTYHFYSRTHNNNKTRDEWRGFLTRQ